MNESGTAEPKSIGKYEIEATLGTGSMGVVYRARDPEIGRVVAIKTLRNVYLGEDANSEAMQRFRQESRSAGKLRHPNIVTVFEAGRTETGTPYIVMEYLAGLSFEEVIAKRAPIDPAETLHLLALIGGAIDYAHAQGVIHRDIKPSNVILDSYGAPFLLDFGVAKLTDTSLTPAGMVVGTPSYMAPEQIRGEQLDGSTDRFALAVMVFEGLTGERPFPGSDFTTVVSNIIHQAPRSVRDTPAAEIPTELDEVISKALAKDRADRHSSCSEMLAAFGQALGLHVDASGVSGYRPGVPWKSLRKPTVAASSQSNLGDEHAEVDAESKLSETAAQPPPRVDLRVSTDQGESERVDSKATMLSPEHTPAGGESWQQSVAPNSPRSSNIPTKVSVPREPNLGFTAALIFLFFIAATAGTYLLAPDLFHETEDKVALNLSDSRTSESTGPVPPVLSAAPVSTVDEAPLVEQVIVDDGTPSDPWPEAGREPAGSATVLTVDDARSEAVTTTTLVVEPTVEATPATTSSEDSKSIIARISVTDPDTMLPELIELSRHSDYTVRIAVLKALVKGSQLRSRDVLRVMVESLNDEEFLVRGFAVKTIASLNNAAALTLIENRKRVETHDVVKKVIDEAVTRLRSAVDDRRVDR